MVFGGWKAAEKAGMELRFGLRISMSNNPTQKEECEHKIVVFIKNSEGCKSNKYTQTLLLREVAFWMKAFKGVVVG